MHRDSKLLIRNAMVVTMDDELGILNRGDILIRGDVIEAIEPSLGDVDADKTIEANGMIAMPGLINGHMHTWLTALRGTVGDMTLREYFARVHDGISRSVSPEDTYLSTAVGALHQIHCGVTTLFDWHHANHSVEHTDAAIDGLVASGIRALYGHGVGRPKLDAPAGAIVGLEHPRKRVERLRNGRLSSDSGLVTLAMCILGPGLSPMSVVEHDVRLARELDLLWSLHTGALGIPSVTADPIEAMRKLGMLGPDGNFVHANNYSDEELRMIIDAGASIAVTPEVELQFGHGVPVTGRVVALGGMPSLGVDLEAMHSGDMFVQMRTALQIQRGFDGLDRPKPIESLATTAYDALRWATIGNARAMRMDHRVGSLKPGKQADITLVRTTDLNMIPLNDPVQSLVFHASAQNVDTVLIAGRVVKAYGKLVHPSDQVKVLTDRLIQVSQRLTARLRSVH
jgi:5-methylthioadenosine/S-adenosylhomocysteine deaminase